MNATLLKRFRPACTLLMGCLGSALIAPAAIPVNGSGGIQEDFNTLPATANATSASWGDNATLPGWWIHRANAGTAGTGGRLAGSSLTYYTADGSTAPNGTPNMHGPLSLGTGEDSNRTLGASPTTSAGEISLIAIFENTSGAMLDLSNVAFDVKVFRSNSSTSDNESISLTWKTGSSQAALLAELDASGAVGALGAMPALGYTAVNPALNHLHVSTVASQHHAPPLTTAKGAAPSSPILLQSGQFLALRWGNVNDGGTDAMIGIDNLVLSFSQPAAAIVGTVSPVSRSLNGTPGDPADDLISFNVTATGSGAVSPSGWRIASPAPFAGPVTYAYASGVAAFTGVPLSAFTPGSSATLRLEDADDPGVFTTVTVTTPLPDPYVTLNRSQSITFSDAPAGATSHARVEGTGDLSWSGGSSAAVVRTQPAPGPSSVKYFGINNARPSFVTESVILTEVPAFAVSVKLAAYTTSTTGFEGPDSLSVVLETSVTGDFTDARPVAWLLDPVMVNGVALFESARIAEPGINYGTVPFPATPFPFITRAAALPRGSATRARIRISGGNDSSSEHTLIDDIIFSPFDTAPGTDSDGDGHSDAAELARTVAGQPAPTNPLSPDTDGDGLSDAAETGTDPLHADTDEDGTQDAAEVASGSNPTDPSSGFVQLHATDEEFNGPFPSWKNVKTDFGAIGDGVVDDTAAIQTALDWFKDMPNVAASVLYFPAGTYRLTNTLLTTRVAHNDYLGFEMVGEDPATTRLVWDGNYDGTMIQLDQWYGKVSRLAFDGGKRAGIGLYREGAFSTYGEISDCWFRDMRRGIQFGGLANGQAETFVNRCRFARIRENAILVTNFNSLDIWVWNSLFYDCVTGLYCAAGNFHAFKNVFLRSSNSDILGSSFVYDLTQNVSIGSNRFANWQTGFIDPLSINILMRGNRIYDFTGDFAIYCNQVGPYFYLDNIIKNRAGDITTSLFPGGNALLVGNRFSVPDAVEQAVIGQAPDGIVRQLDSVLDPGIASPASVSLPRTPPKVNRPVFDVARGTGDDAAAIQTAINAAAASAAARPVVHIGKGTWTLARTVFVPTLRDLQIVGDGASENGTSLLGSGARRFLLRLRGPSRATLRDISVGNDQYDGILAENASQIGGRIYGEQLSAAVSSSNGLLLEGVEDSDVTLLAAGIGSATVAGGPKLSAGQPADGQISIFGGAGGNATPVYSVRNGGRLLSEAVYHEISDYSRFNAIDLPEGGTGSLTVAMGRLTYASSPTVPLIRSSGWRGTLSLIGNFYVVPGGGFNDEAHWLDFQGDGSEMQTLVLGGSFSTLPPAGSPLTQTDFIFRDTTSPAADAGIYLACKANDSTGNSYRLNTQYRKTPDAPGDDYLRSMLAMLREARIEGPQTRAPGVTDLKLYRVYTGVNPGTNIIGFRAIGSIDVRQVTTAQEQVIRFTEPGVGASSYLRTSAAAAELGWDGGTSSSKVARQPAPGPADNLYFDINSARVEFATESVDITAVSQLRASLRLAAYTTSGTGFESDDTVSVILETSISGDFDDAVETARLLDAGALDGTALFALLKVSDPGLNYGSTTPYPSAAFPFVSREVTVPRGSARYARLRISGGNNSSSEHLLVDDIAFSDASPPNPDSDNDGLPDAWELSHFGNLTSQAGAGDADQDGASNAAELLAGTLPANPASLLTITVVSAAGAGFMVTWSSVPGKTYRIETSPSPGAGGPWTDLQTSIPASSGETTSWSLALAPFSESRIFLRVAVMP